MRPAAEQLQVSLAVVSTWPDFMQVWPGHGAGSACGKALGAVPWSTVGYERRFNGALSLAAESRRTSSTRSCRASRNPRRTSRG